MKKSTISLSVIVPAYNQEKSIEQSLIKISDALNQIRMAAEIICVVDGFTDGTYEKAINLEKKITNLKVIGYAHNKGKGHAVRFGMAHSKGEIIGFIDAGMDINPNGLSMLLEHFEWYKADIIVGSKRHAASKVNYPWQRRILSFAYQMITRILFGLKIKDSQVGIKFYKREVLEKVLPRLIIKQFAFDIEILTVANRLGFKRMYEAPVEIVLKFGKDSIITSKKFWYFIGRMLLDTLAVYYRLNIIHYYDDNHKREWVFDPDLNFRVNTV